MPFSLRGPASRILTDETTDDALYILLVRPDFRHGSDQQRWGMISAIFPGKLID